MPLVQSGSKERLKKLVARQPDDVELKRYLAEAFHGLGEVYLDRDTGAARLSRAVDPRSTAVVVLAVAKATVNTNRRTAFVDNDDGVHPVGFANAAEILE